MCVFFNVSFVCFRGRGISRYPLVELSEYFVTPFLNLGIHRTQELDNIEKVMIVDNFIFFSSQLWNKKRRAHESSSCFGE